MKLGKGIDQFGMPLTERSEYEQDAIVSADKVITMLRRLRQLHPLPSDSAPHVNSAIRSMEMLKDSILTKEKKRE